MLQGASAEEQTASDGQEKVLENIPSYSQESTEWCAWVSAQMVLSYYGYTVSPQAVAVETFKLADQTWGGNDKDGLPWRYYRFYGDAIRSLSDNNLDIEEVTTQNKDEVLYKIFEAIDRGYPVILVSGGPWLYDATDLPELSWIEFSPESSWPNGGHASVIVGYSLKEEMNNFLTVGPLTFFTNLLDYPPVVKIHDPATAAIGVGTYWVSYDKLFEKTIGYPAVTRLIIVKPSSGDNAPPITQAFQVSPLSLTSGEPFTIDYTVSDNSGSGLKQVELWRKDEQSDWQEIDRNTLAGENGPTSDSFTDSPSAPGKYWYGIHVVDNAGNWNDEKNTNTNYQPSEFEPVEVVVKEAAIAKVSSQADVSGHWDGELYQLSKIFSYSLDLTQTGSDVRGISKISFGQYYAIMDLTGSFSNGVLSFTETGIREHFDQPGRYFILKTANLNYEETPNEVLEGNWECYDSPTVPCNYATSGTGKIQHTAVG